MVNHFNRGGCRGQRPGEKQQERRRAGALLHAAADADLEMEAHAEAEQLLLSSLVEDTIVVVQELVFEERAQFRGEIIIGARDDLPGETASALRVETAEARISDIARDVAAACAT